MNRPWRSGHAVRIGLWVALAVLILGAISAIFALRAQAIAVAAREVKALREEQNKLWAEIENLKSEIKRAEDPKVVEKKAREVLHWAYPDEELVILIRRR